MDWSSAEPYLKAEILRFSDVYAVAIGKPDGWRNVKICIADNGSGMSSEVQQRIFDPFFTTSSLPLNLWAKAQG